MVMKLKKGTKKMTEQQMIDEMLELQRKYDDAVYKEFGCEYNRDKVRLALFDELGEVNHELKKEWCWWKKTQKPVDREKVLEEIVDCFHFALSIVNHECIDGYKWKSFEVRTDKKLRTTLSMYKVAIGEPIDVFILESLYNIAALNKFSFEEVFEAYKKKNKINWERLENNY